ncbi:MAG TPA: alcohol dehydrogenase catalytic domain-containing protein [Ktedonobacteraceae bacterium]|nr:alcohol dehydrogenase catalytic domain-containing protein [Ktedonobacteraceae bacterium]
MRALVRRETGLVLERDYPMPAPVDGEVLIRVLLAGICNTDLEIVHGYLSFQGVLGHEFVGVVQEIYGDVAQERYGHLVGKRVVGEINAACHRPDCPSCQSGMPTHCPNRTTLGIVNRDGAFAEYLMLPVENLHAVPDEVSDEEAVFIEPLAANFEIGEQVHLKPTDNVVIVGDGKMGQLAAQVLLLNGCTVSMVGKHKEKLALAEKQGVHPYLLDDTQDFTLEHGHHADVVVECSGSSQGLTLALRLIRPRGVVVLKTTTSNLSTLHLAPIVIDEIRVQGSRCGPFPPAIRALSQRTVDVLPLISARYSLDEGLDAFGHAGEKAVLKVLIRI